MPALLPLRRPSASLALLLTAAPLFALAGCDSGGPADDAAAPGAPSSAQGASGADSLLLVPAPPGSELLPLPEGGQDSYADGDLPRGASPYGCIVSTLRSEKEIAAGAERYRYDSYFLHFPAGLLEQAEGTHQATFVLGGAAAPAHAQAMREVVSEEDVGAAGVMRLAQCRLPGGGDTAAQARAMMQERLEQVSGPDRWITNLNAGGEEGQDGWECAFILVVMRGDEIKSIRCTEWVWIPDTPEEDDPPTGGGDDGDNTGGDDSDPCHIDGDPMLDGPCIDGGGGFSDGGEEEETPASLADDYMAGADTSNYDCSQPESEMFDTERAWCASASPTGDWLQWTEDALDRIETRGPECATIAQRGGQLLNQDGLRYYPTWIDIGDSSGRGGPGLGVLLAELWVIHYHDNIETAPDKDGSEVTLNLDLALAHEIEHEMGRHHIELPNGEESDWLTPHAAQCSGVN